MKKISAKNPAEIEAEKATKEMYKCIETGKSFILEAGAGAGKTYSLINALEYLINDRGIELAKKNKKIACITFTNVAKQQIEERTDKHPVIHSDTIHAFSWSLIRSFQAELKTLILANEKWNERIQEYGNIKKHEINYDFGYPSIDDKFINLHHDDVLMLTVSLLSNEKFRRIFVDKYPILFIDEYQDTDVSFATALQEYFLVDNSPMLLGFFGDHWQKIYGDGCGQILNTHLKAIEKNSNFRSSPAIVNVLNKIREELPQVPKEPEKIGSAKVWHSNSWGGERMTKNHWQGDLPPEVSHEFLEKLKSHLAESEGWDFSPEETKILMLTHNVLADEQGYRNLADIFPFKELLIKKEDKFIKFFADTLEPVCEAYSIKKYGQMFKVLNKKKPSIKSYAEKQTLVEEMDELTEIRKTGTIGDVIEFLEGAEIVILPDTLKRKLKELRETGDEPETSSLTRLKKLLTISYREVTTVTRFINKHTPFATKHSVKGDEFENVLVVFGRGWNQYDFNEMLSWEISGVPPEKQDRYERGRNLFYVSCSRPKTNLVLLFTQKLSEEALITLNSWFSNQVLELD